MDLKIIRDKLVGNDQERAVSPVIGVILMVAITVILAAVIAAFVLDMQPGGAQAPQANYDWNSNSEEVTLSHTSGEEIEYVSTKMNVDHAHTVDNLISDDTLSVGDTIYFWVDDTNSKIVISDDTADKPAATDLGNPGDMDKITLIWDEGDSGSILTEYEP